MPAVQFTRQWLQRYFESWHSKHFEGTQLGSVHIQCVYWVVLSSESFWKIHRFSLRWYKIIILFYTRVYNLMQGYITSFCNSFGISSEIIYLLAIWVLWQTFCAVSSTKPSFKPDVSDKRVLEGGFRGFRFSQRVVFMNISSCKTFTFLLKIINRKVTYWVCLYFLSALLLGLI